VALANKLCFPFVETALSARRVPAPAGKKNGPGEPIREREFFIDNLLVRIHFIIVMIRWTGLSPWDFEKGRKRFRR